MKKIITILIIVAIATGVYFLAFSEKEKTVAYETITVKRGNINTTVTATGTLEPITQVDVGTQVSGTIAKIYVDYNSIVTKGMLLAELDQKLLKAELASQEATVESCKSEYEYQQKNYNRIAGLHEKNLISDTEYEQALYLYETATRSYEKAQADMVKSKQNLDYAIITSPIDGVVLSKEVEEGQTVAASFETPTMFTIADDLRKMQVIADVDEADIGQVEEGQRVTFTVDAYPDDTFEGNVTQVRLQPTTENNVVTYEVVISAPNPDLKLKPGLTANITIYTMEKNNILLAPMRTFRFMPQEPITTEIPTAQRGEKVVWQQTPAGIKPLVVKTGVSDGINTEIVSGVKEGDQLVTGIQQDQFAPMEQPTGENNPFMPGHPGQDRNKKKNK
ncbi:MAG: efflux RND transporter periplasmic adaptor subunit [Marinifilaceae bacterium]|nr:efflux RND transporter periplasmic adaptor subunit [Marinifilaceae bacterium]